MKKVLVVGFALGLMACGSKSPGVDCKANPSDPACGGSTSAAGGSSSGSGSSGSSTGTSTSTTTTTGSSTTTSTTTGGSTGHADAGCPDVVNCGDPACGGISCDDGDPCTVGEVCTNGSCGGGTAVVCNTPPSECYQGTGTCNALNAVDGGDPCVYAALTVGTGCVDDGNSCTNDICDGNGTCQHSPVFDGTVCDDGNLCTLSDSCQSGVCVGASQVSCAQPDQCHSSNACDPQSGQCVSTPVQDGATCDDGNPCTSGDVCTSGVCAGQAYSCTPSACQDSSTCDGQGGCTVVNKAVNTPCDDGNPCTLNDVCGANDGVCHPGSQMNCVPTDACHTAGVCDPQSGQCTNPTGNDGASCDDGNECTGNDICAGGNCIGNPAVMNGATCGPDPTACVSCQAGQCLGNCAGTCCFPGCAISPASCP